MAPNWWQSLPGSIDRRLHRRERPQQAKAAILGVLLLQMLANGIGGFIVWVYLAVLFPLHLPDGGQQETLNLTVFSLYIAATFVIAVPINAIVLRHAINWVREGREPTKKERHATLALPARQTLSAFIGWLGAALIFGLVNKDVARVSFGIAFAGLETCSMLYLLLERHFRPLFALGLAEEDLPEDRREILPRLMLAWLVGSATPLVAIAVIFGFVSLRHGPHLTT